MVVQHNLTAMNSNRMLGITTKSQAKSTEKLSSGYRINRAADDAAGLSISEKMRKQIRGLTQASANAQDGISAVQTAEGALGEVQDMLQRMNELAVKAANGTNSTDDRSYIQNEIDQLSTEIDRVAETTKFNESYLLKGDKTAEKNYSFAYKKFGAAETGAATFAVDAATNLSIGTKWTAQAASTEKIQDEINELMNSFKNQGVGITWSSKYDDVIGQASSGYTIQLTGALADNYVVEGTTNQTTGVGTFKIKDLDGNLLFDNISLTGGSLATATSKNVSASATITASQITATKSTGAQAAYYDKDGNKISGNALESYFAGDVSGTPTVRGDAGQVYDAVGNLEELKPADVSCTKDKIAALQLSLQVGADATGNNQITMSLEAMTAKGLGVNFLKVDGIDDSNALSAIETIKQAIQKVSTQRSALGAIQNRLEHTINNLDNVVENTTSAESAIRDTDMASEMVKYSNNNILAQAGQSMLAQANQANQGVLSLLQG
ncbi:MAG: flagellar hook protein [Lachnospiraceae bacterium]|nr:flagellar hook protein [Candidatus Colinaster equi]